MASPKVALLFSPGFQQLFDSCLDREIALIERMVAESELPQCTWEETWGLNDGGIRCEEPATVHHLGIDLPYCAKHFRAVSR